LWLSPVQAILIPIADRHIAYANQVAKELRAAGLRVEVDRSGDRMNKQIRNAQMQKIPYMLVVGDNEVEEGKVAVRTRENEDRGPVNVADFIAQASNLIAAKSMEI
jgi:threonyl-tRNA synthetase